MVYAGEDATDNPLYALTLKQKQTNNYVKFLAIKDTGTLCLFCWCIYKCLLF